MKWLKNIRAALVRDIATETERRLTASGWGKFLPPVRFQDCIYLMREDGTLYRMQLDSMQGMEVIVKIKDHW